MAWWTGHRGDKRGYGRRTERKEAARHTRRERRQREIDEQYLAQDPSDVENWKPHAEGWPGVARALRARGEGRI